ncbi:MAG: winged helix-turn-helix domain-containing protein [Candidatus Bathyarchaeia archaeon]|nr:winged helix-turn-helix transcriptional regulator [Candidatus Bathyarchaeota archaeon]
MSKETYHPNAYLSDFRNVKLGLRVRSKILTFLESVNAADAETIAKHYGLSYNVVIHHLKLLENQGIVGRRGRRPSIWYLTGFGQRRLQ